MKTLRLKAGREKSLQRRHPWIFSGAVEAVEGADGGFADGETLRVVSAGGDFLAWAAGSGQSQIRGRVWSWEAQDTIDRNFFAARIAQALAARQELAGLFLPGQVDALRLVHGESDGLPGLVVDRYADTLVVQILSSGPEYWRETLLDLLVEQTGIERVYERSDVDVRTLEGLALRSGPLRGSEPPERLQIHENGLRFWVDVRHGHKTGYYLDQRSNRLQVGRLARGRDVLDCFSYTGGFAAYALRGGAASVLAVDSSADALAAGGENLALNDLPLERAEFMEGDVFYVLRRFRDQRRSFDMIILDPPKFAPTSAQVERAARGYKDINLLAFKLLRPGGILATFSCSGGVDAALFQKIVAGAALDAGVNAQIIHTLHQDYDHPVALAFPEGAYLKGLVLRV